MIRLRFGRLSLAVPFQGILFLLSEDEINRPGIKSEKARERLLRRSRCFHLSFDM